MVTTAFLDDSVLRAAHPSVKSAYYYSIHLYSSIGYWIGYYYTYTYSTYSIGRFYRCMSGSQNRIGTKCGTVPVVTIPDEYSLAYTAYRLQAYRQQCCTGAVYVLCTAALCMLAYHM